MFENELLLFHLPHCPHCLLARRCLDELRREDPRYAAIPLRLINEKKEKALADSFDYYFVPTFFYNGEKLFEGHMEKSDVQAVLARVLALSEPAE